MKKVLALVGLAALVAGALAGAAVAKEAGVELSSTPFGTKPGEPWTGMLVVISPEPEMLRQARPSITIRNLGTGDERTFPATAVSDEVPAGEAREFAFRVVFPAAGRYSYSAQDGVSDRVYEFLPVQIGAPAVAPPAAASPGEGTSFPVWPLVGGLAALAAAVGLVIVVRRRRLGFSH